MNDELNVDKGSFLDVPTVNYFAYKSHFFWWAWNRVLEEEGVQMGGEILKIDEC